MRLLSIDPGGTGKGQTGIVLIEFTPETLPIALDSWAVPDGFSGWLEWADSHPEVLSEPEFVVCEHFVQRNVLGADLTPTFIEGSVRTLRRDVVLQPAAGKNTMVPDAVLTSLGMRFPGDHHHDRREAARHALVWLRKNHHRPTLLHISHTSQSS